MGRNDKIMDRKTRMVVFILVLIVGLFTVNALTSDEQQFVLDMGISFGYDTTEKFFQFYIEDEQIMNLANGTLNLSTTKETDIILTPYAQSAEPDIPPNSIALWQDTDTSENKLVMDFGGSQDFLSPSIGPVPVGSIVPWMKSFTGVPSLPDGWLEADGSVVSDSESPLDGQTLPDLNGEGRYLKGGSTSGTSGGSSLGAHQHAMPFMASGTSMSYSNAGCIYGTVGSDVLGDESTHTADTSSDKNDACLTADNSGAETAEPPYYQIVWIIRIK